MSSLPVTAAVYPKSSNLPDSANGYQALDAAVLGDLPLDVLNEDQWAALVGCATSKHTPPP